ncbi:MAG: flagellar basal body rod protein [Rubrivivax sp.]|nr:flagellar basal body rod protein [Rubrivivax sp.]
MMSMSAVSLSGLSAAVGGMQVAAHNVANAPVDGFRRQRALPATAPEGGVTLSYGQAEAAGDDLAADMVGLLQSKNAFLANLAVFKRADEAFGKLLEIA